MFNKLKQFKDLRDQAKEMQNELAKETVTVEKNGVTLTMNGNLDITNVNIEADLLEASNKTKVEDAFVKAYESAKKKMQRTMAMKMKEMGGFPNIPGLG